MPGVNLQAVAGDGAADLPDAAAADPFVSINRSLHKDEP